MGAEFSGDLVHGGALDLVQAQFPASPTPWVDLSTGINPWSWPAPSIPDGSLHHLPTHAAFASCREAMATCFGAPTQSVLPVPGTELIIRLLPLVLGAPGRRVRMARATYADHAKAWRAAGARVHEVEDPLALPIDDDLVICNPNNPTGEAWERAQLEAACAAGAPKGRWLIVDEAYADLTPEHSLAPSGGRDGLVILRSFGKFFGMAGVRLGALIAPAQVIEDIERLLGQWAVGAPALWYGARAYADHAWQRQTRQRLHEAQAALDCTLLAAGAGHGLEIKGGTALYRYVRVDDAYRSWFTLARAGVYVRRFAWSRRHLRIGLPAAAPALDRLRAALMG